MRTTETKEIKKVTDPNLIAYLLTVGFKLHRLPDPSSSYLVFEFEKTGAMEQACLNYFSKQTSVDALTYAEHLRNIKTMVNELKKRPRGER